MKETIIFLPCPPPILSMKCYLICSCRYSAIVHLSPGDTVWMTTLDMYIHSCWAIQMLIEGKRCMEGNMTSESHPFLHIPPTILCVGPTRCTSSSSRIHETLKWLSHNIGLCTLFMLNINWRTKLSKDNMRREELFISWKLEASGRQRNLLDDCDITKS